MAIDRVNLSSVAYWRGQRQPQRFYVAFCLLMSSIQDSLLGFKERSSANLNWSATCSYYSLVHAGRLLAFIALGDFPTNHGDLRRLIGGPQRQARRRSQALDGYPFDWLRGFSDETIPDAQQREPGAPTPVPGRYSELRDAIVGYLTDIRVQRASERFDQFGGILASAAELRNDSNYEALLIAHEYEHVTMTSAFETLSQRMCDAADWRLPFVIEAFTCFLRRDSDLEQDRGAYFTFAHEYLSRRLVPAMHRKLTGFDELKEKLSQMVSRIDVPPTGADYHRLEHAASLDIFGGKARLMGAFQGRIEELRRVVGRGV